MKITRETKIQAFGGLGILVGFFLTLTITFSVLAILPLAVVGYFYMKLRTALAIDNVWDTFR